MEETKKLGFESAADGVGLFDKENPKNLPTEDELTVAMETAHRESRKVSKLLFSWIANSDVTLTPHDGRWRLILNQLSSTKNTEES